MVNQQDNPYKPNDTSKLPTFNLAKMGYVNTTMMESNDNLTMTILNGGSYASHLMTQVSDAKFQSKAFRTLVKGALDTRLNELDPSRPSVKPFNKARYGGSNSPLAIYLEELKSPERKQKTKSKYQYNKGYDNYKTDKKKDKKNVKNDYKAFEDIASAIYSITKRSGEITAIEYDPLEKQTELAPRQTLETLAYSAAANMHAYQSLSISGATQHYIAKDGNYTVALSKG
jgi:hypothetical protein